ncbi:MAG TPA: energy transducer TonB [Bryobacteraceae bacterium]|jgi:TonB family protein|nr:energy transducer TonB [Bryobacteraceae bacterium]
MKVNYKAAVKTMMMTALMVVASGLVMGQEAVLNVSKTDALKNATSKVSPTYPPMARQLGMQGDVEVEARITEEGTVESVKPLTGNPVLLNAAVAAMKQWKFTPFTNEGKAVKAVAPVTFTFKL